MQILKSTYTTLSVFLCFFMLIMTSCEHSKIIAPEQSEATLAKVQNDIFSPKCAVSGCHVPGTFAPIPLRTANESYTRLVGVASSQKPNLNRVTPNEPDDSYLIQKIRGASGISGGRMPLNSSALSSSEIDLIREWIENGAENN